MTTTLPEDILHLISVELAERNDFGTLFNCAVSSKAFSGPAVTGLYRIYHRSTVKDEASEIALAQQSLAMMKWSILWKSVILSCLGKTVYPYHRYIRVLDLRDFINLLDDDKFKSKISASFFSNGLEQFRITRNKTRAWLDVGAIVKAVGELITQNTSMLEEITGTIEANSLMSWVPRMTKLRTLDLYSGEPLGDETLQALIHANCKQLESIRLYIWPSAQCDEEFGKFINGMTAQTLRSLETINDIKFGAISFLALANHSKSLTTLKLSLKAETIPYLALLRDCTALETLYLTDARGPVDLESMDSDAFKEMTAWLQECNKLRFLSFTDFAPSVTKMVTPLLTSRPDQLEELQIEYYSLQDSCDFHLALASQTSLSSLSLRAEPAMDRDSNDFVIDRLSELKNLKVLQLRELADFLGDGHIIKIAENLTELEELIIGGLGPTDDVLYSLCQLSKLRSLTLTGLSTFTVKALLNFVESLGPGNSGLILTVDMADANKNPLSENQQVMVRHALENKVGGRFEYTFWRDPEVSSFASDTD